MYKDIREFMEKLRVKGDIVEIKDELSTLYEISGVMKYMDKYNPSTLFFNKVKGYEMPIIGNLLGRRRRLALAMDIDEDKIGEEYILRRENPVKPVIMDNAPVKEVIIKNNSGDCQNRDRR